jgi:dihydroxyacid dehydratase/phosphogluconate dehydratase
MPQTYGTITISDGVSMGTEGMKCSLVSREVIADSIETVAPGQMHDGALDRWRNKNMPGALIALARLDIPAIFVTAARSRPAATAKRPHGGVGLRSGRRARRRRMNDTDFADRTLHVRARARAVACTATPWRARSRRSA